MIEKVHAVVISGGSAFGLASSCGVMDALAERTIGFELAGMHVPIVVSACLFDLLVGARKATSPHLAPEPPRRLSQAVATRSRRETSAQDAAPPSARCCPEQAMKSGLGVAGVKANDLVVCAIVAVNALGQVRSADGTWIAGCHDANRVMDPLEVVAARAGMAAAASEGAQAPCTNTTLGIVATNADITKAQATKVASTTRRLRPRHQARPHLQRRRHHLHDRLGDVPADVDTVSILAAEAMQQAIERAITEARAPTAFRARATSHVNRSFRKRERAAPDPPATAIGGGPSIRRNEAGLQSQRLLSERRRGGARRGSSPRPR